MGGHHKLTASTVPADQVELAKGSMWRKLPGIGLVLALAGLGGAFGIHSGNTKALHDAEAQFEAVRGEVLTAAGAEGAKQIEAAEKHFEEAQAHLEELKKNQAEIAGRREGAVAAVKGSPTPENKRHFTEVQQEFSDTTLAIVKARKALSHAVEGKEHAEEAVAQSVAPELAEKYEEAHKAELLAHNDVQQFWYSYLTAFMFFLSLGLGGLFFVIVQHLVRAGWSIVVRRIAENVAITLPAVCILGIPFLTHDVAHYLFHWTHSVAVEADQMLAWKQAYLNPEFFNIRMIAFMLIWSGLAYFFYSNSVASDTAPQAEVEKRFHRMRYMSAPALFLFALSATFGVFDLLMSLDPHWFSTMFGVYFFAGSAVTIHALLALLVLAFHQSGYLREVINIEHYHDLGKLMFGFTVFWTYIGFSQYFLIWYANIPEETMWFAYRIKDDFLALSVLLCLGRFAVPFFYLLRRPVKRNPMLLAVGAVIIVFMQFVDHYWLVQPVLAHHFAAESGSHHMELVVGAFDYLTLLGIGGVFIAAFGYATGRSCLIPRKDPRLTESLQFENF